MWLTGYGGSGVGCEPINPETDYAAPYRVSLSILMHSSHPLSRFRNCPDCSDGRVVLWSPPSDAAIRINEQVAVDSCPVLVRMCVRRALPCWHLPHLLLRRGKLMQSPKTAHTSDPLRRWRWHRLRITKVERVQLLRRSSCDAFSHTESKQPVPHAPLHIVGQMLQQPDEARGAPDALVVR